MKTLCCYVKRNAEKRNYCTNVAINGKKLRREDYKELCERINVWTNMIMNALMDLLRKCMVKRSGDG